MSKAMSVKMEMAKSCVALGTGQNESDIELKSPLVSAADLGNSVQLHTHKIKDRFTSVFESMKFQSAHADAAESEICTSPDALKTPLLFGGGARAPIQAHADTIKSKFVDVFDTVSQRTDVATFKEKLASAGATMKLSVNAMKDKLEDKFYTFDTGCDATYKRNDDFPAYGQVELLHPDDLETPFENVRRTTEDVVVESLLDMGFARDDILKALHRANGEASLDVIVNLLCKQQERKQKEARKEAKRMQASFGADRKGHRENSGNEDACEDMGITKQLFDVSVEVYTQLALCMRESRFEDECWKPMTCRPEADAEAHCNHNIDQGIFAAPVPQSWHTKPSVGTWLLPLAIKHPTSSTTTAMPVGDHVAEKVKTASCCESSPRAAKLCGA